MLKFFSFWERHSWIIGRRGSLYRGNEKEEEEDPTGGEVFERRGFSQFARFSKYT